MAVIGLRVETGRLLDAIAVVNARVGPERNSLERKGLFSLKEKRKKGESGLKRGLMELI